MFRVSAPALFRITPAALGGRLQRPPKLTQTRKANNIKNQKRMDKVEAFFRKYSPPKDSLPFTPLPYQIPKKIAPAYKIPPPPVEDLL